MNKVIITDANIIFSALISDSEKIRLILAKNDLQFVAPKFIVVELFKHAQRIQKSSKLSRGEILELLSSIINRIKLYEDALISVGSWAEAARLCRDVDEKDTPYIALALELDAEVWTDDKELKIGLAKKGFDRFYLA